MITLTQLEYIVAVDTYRHFATAAEKCFITQPTLSMQIKKLEEDLGVIIFDRSKHPIIPTDIGERIIEQSRTILKETKEVNNIVQEYQNLIEGNLKIGIIPTLSPYLLPLFIGNFSRKYPKVSIQIEELYTTKIVDALKKDILDVGILVTPLKEEHIYEVPLFYEGLKIYAHRHHPILQKKLVTVKDLLTPEIWLLSDGHCFRHQVINLCKLKNDVRRDLPFNFDGGSLETLMKIIDREGGFTLIPELALKDIPNEKLKQVRSFSNITPLREVSLVFSRHFAKHKLFKLLQEEISKSIPSDFLNKSRGTIVEWK